MKCPLIVLAVMFAASHAAADEILVTSLDPTAFCRDANNKKTSIRPFGSFNAMLDIAAHRVVTMLGGKPCYLDLSEVGFGATQACSTAAASHPPDQKTDGSRDLPSHGTCTQ